MEKQLIVEAKRMQQLAGLITENITVDDLKKQMGNEDFGKKDLPKDFINRDASWQFRMKEEELDKIIDTVKNTIVNNDEAANQVLSAWEAKIKKGVQNWTLNDWKQIYDYLEIKKLLKLK